MPALSPSVATAAGWRARAACRDADPDLFFPAGTTGPAAGQAAEAKRVCAGCPVRRACLDWAMTHHEKDGVWGGLDEAERHRARRLRLRRRREYAA